VPKGTTHNTDFFCNEVLPSLKRDIASRGRRETLRRLVIHMDNARPQNSERVQECILASKAGRLPHPAYSPDLAPSDFFLFGHLKEKVIDYNCETREQLKEAIIEIFNEIPQDALVSVFMSWTKRFRWVIKHEGQYFRKSDKHDHCSLNIHGEKGRVRTYGLPIVSLWRSRPRRNSWSVCADSHPQGSHPISGGPVISKCDLCRNNSFLGHWSQRHSHQCHRFHDRGLSSLPQGG
jgi:hypothetical protein